MTISILYHPHSEFARAVETFATDFERFHGISVALMSLETKEGAELAKLYDIVKYPAVLVMHENGSLVKEWQGDTLPLMNEVASYLVR